MKIVTFSHRPGGFLQSPYFHQDRLGVNAYLVNSVVE